MEASPLNSPLIPSVRNISLVSCHGVLKQLTVKAFYLLHERITNGDIKFSIFSELSALSHLESNPIIIRCPELQQGVYSLIARRKIVELAISQT